MNKQYSLEQILNALAKHPDFESLELAMEITGIPKPELVWYMNGKYHLPIEPEYSYNMYLEVLLKRYGWQEIGCDHKLDLSYARYGENKVYFKFVPDLDDKRYSNLHIGTYKDFTESEANLSIIRVRTESPWEDYDNCDLVGIFHDKAVILENCMENETPDLHIEI